MNGSGVMTELRFDPNATLLVFPCAIEYLDVVLKSLSLADARVENVEALCYTIPEEYGIDGVIGLNFLRHFNIGLDFKQGVLTLNR